jgi:hypothetical protein
MSFTKEKTVVVSAKDFLEEGAFCHAEFEHEQKHYLVQVVPDYGASNPREEYDPIWTWATTRGANYSDKGAMDPDEWLGMGKAEREKYLAFPLGLLRHSGDTLYVGSGGHWSDQAGWDSGCVGVAYVTKEQALREWGSVWKNGELVRQGKRLSRRARERALRSLQAEVKEMNMFLHGEVCGVIATCLETENSDSCWGYYYDSREGIASIIKDMLPDGMTEAEKDVVISALEWE